MKLAMTNFSLRHPWIIVLATFLVTLIFAGQFPKVHFDNDPENMLSEDEHVRMFHNMVKEKYSLYDFVIVGIINEVNPDGAFNVETLEKINSLTEQILSLRQDENGLPMVSFHDHEGNTPKELHLDLSPQGIWKRILNKAFRHDPNKLFDENGNSAIIAREVIAPSVVDNIKQADLGSLKLEYLMENVPTNREEAMQLRDNAMSNPLYNGTLVSESEKAICIYLPIIEKTYSYNVARLVRALTEDWQGDEQVLITGLPVAEDTFGIEMLIQMATSAPLAGVAIFILLLFFFKRISLIIAPMLVAVISVVCTMGLLIGLDIPVHIMSSMIAIFLMPIAVADAVHILSEFFDLYHQFNDKAKTIRHVVGHLFIPMLYTSLTTIAGFGSLWFTPIPPVKVFGAHVAFGVGLAWVLTMTLIPAYIILFVSEKSLKNLIPPDTKRGSRGLLNRSMEWLGSLGYLHSKTIIMLTILTIGISVYGITKIQVNDNPVKWFIREHPIRQADASLNSHFGGTYTAYLTLSAVSPDCNTCKEKADIIRAEAKKRFGTRLPEATAAFINKLDSLKQLYSNVQSSDIQKCFVKLVKEAEIIDNDAGTSWNSLADEVIYLDPEGLTHEDLVLAISNVQVPDTDRQTFIALLAGFSDLSGHELQDKALEICDSFLELSFQEFVFEMEAELTAPLFKQPEILRYLEAIQQHLGQNKVVGKSSSAVDALKKAAYELRYVAPPADAGIAEEAEYEAINNWNFSIPKSASAVGQVFTQLEGMKKKDSLFHLVTKDYQEANIWVQLKSGDNRDMESVVSDMNQFIQENSPPVPMIVEWAGLTYLNVVWQDKMVKGMLSSLISSFVVVLIMMMMLFRSPLYGVLAMIPLSVTISFIYGLIGLIGKDYDMPVAVLSALTLGLSVDFAIHFLERAREEQKRLCNWKKACSLIFKEPAVAISRNAIVISIGFTPLLLAPLVPYKTVGVFLVAIMAMSWLATLFILPALLTKFRKIAFPKDE